jgi:hypothetical protein
MALGMNPGPREERDFTMSDQSGEKTAADLIRYLAQHHNEQAAYDRHNRFKGAKGSKRDIQIHFVVTKMPAVNGNVVVGEKELEFPQMACQISAQHLPLKRENAAQVVASISEKILQQLFQYGFLET